MKRAYRLRTPEQYQRVRRDGRTWDAGMLMLNAAPNRRRLSRCGFVTPKRLGGAVTRNRIRRRVREAVRLLYPQIVPGWDIVFIARSPALAEIAFPQLQALVQTGASARRRVAGVRWRSVRHGMTCAPTTDRPSKMR